jgi:soluble lytic murein transglycosylase-like protein
MGFARRRCGDRRQSARGPEGSAGTRGRRGARFTRAGVAAALAIMSRQTGSPLPAEDRAQVEVETGNSQLPDYDRADLDELIEEAAAAHGISAHLVRAVVEAESGFDPCAVSPAGAQGLMQLMPDTATLMGVSDPLDPRQNVFGGAKYLSQLLDRFDGNVALALAGYNAGPTKVARHGGIPPFRETRGYVTKIRDLLAETTGALFPLPRPAVARSARTATVRRAWAARLRQDARRRLGHSDRDPRT